MKKISFDDVVKASETIAQSILESGFKPDYLIGVATGGLYALALISKKLNNKQIFTITATSKTVHNNKAVTVQYFPKLNLEGKNILLIDDITDSGKTLDELSKRITSQYNPKQLKTAALGCNMDNSKILPDFYYFVEKGEWIKFPWEDEVFSEYPY